MGLVLARKPHESIVIDLSTIDLRELARHGNLITVSVVKIEHDKVRLTINAHPDIAVDREEVYRFKHDIADDVNLTLAARGDHR